MINPGRKYDRDIPHEAGWLIYELGWFTYKPRGSHTSHP